MEPIVLPKVMQTDDPLDPNYLLSHPLEMPTNNNLKDLLKYIEEGTETYYKMLRSMSSDNLYIFNRHVLDVERDKCELIPIHRKMCNFVTDNKNKKKLLLIPRGHLKSTLITVGYSLQRIVTNPNIRILIMNGVWQLAVDFLSEIKKHLQENEKLIKVFGSLATDPTEWSQDRITINRPAHNIKEPTVQAAGINSSLVGSHPDLIILDDPHNRENISTRDQIDKVILKFKDLIDLLEPGGQLIIIGTIWAEGDLYGWIMDKDNPVHNSFDVMLERAYTGDLVNNEDLNILWKEKFSRQDLLSRLNEKGWYEFSSQYLNKAVPPEDADFKREWFQYYEPEDYRYAQMKNIMTIDPAISEKKDADFTAMVVQGIDQFSNIFIKDLYRKRVNPGRLIEDIFLLYELWHPQLIVIESILFQRVLAYALQQESRRRNKYLPIHEIKNQDRSKELRIKGLQPLYMNKKIFHHKGNPYTKYLEDELLTFPRGLHDDVSDAVSMGLDYLTPPKTVSSRIHRKYLY